VTGREVVGLSFGAPTDEIQVDVGERRGRNVAHHPEPERKASTERLERRP
jgi:hypothetical protein